MHSAHQYCCPAPVSRSDPSMLIPLLLSQCEIAFSDVENCELVTKTRVWCAVKLICIKEKQSQARENYFSQMHKMAVLRNLMLWFKGSIVSNTFSACDQLMHCNSNFVVGPAQLLPVHLNYC